MNNSIEKKYKIVDPMHETKYTVKIESRDMYLKSLTAQIPIGVDVYQLNRAMSFLRSIKLEDQMILFVNTSEGHEPDVLASLTSFKTNQAYLQGKWIPGLLSNWNSMNNTIRNFRNLKTAFRYAAINDWSRYKDKSIKSRFLDSTKQISNIKIITEYQQAKKNHLLGIAKFLKRPSLVIILGVDSNSLAAVREAQKSGIPTIGVVSMDTLDKYPKNTILSCITYPIIYNSKSINSFDNSDTPSSKSDKKTVLYSVSEHISDLLLERLPRIKYFKYWADKMRFLVEYSGR